MEEEVLEQEVVETPEISESAEIAHEEPVVEQEPVIEEESPAEEVVAEPVPEPIQVYTKGKWADLELLTEKEMEAGKTYHIKVSGHCQFAVSAEQPTAGVATNEITFTKQDGLKLWIKTGE